MFVSLGAHNFIGWKMAIYLLSNDLPAHMQEQNIHGTSYKKILMQCNKAPSFYLCPTIGLDSFRLFIEEDSPLSN